MSTNSYCVAPILKILIPLSSSPSLSGLALRLLAKLWDNQNRIFPRIQSIISGYDSERQAEEVRIAIASTVRDVCVQDSDSGLDLIAPLSNIITKDRSAIVVALGLESLTALCREDAVDFRYSLTACDVFIHILASNSIYFLTGRLGQ